MHFTRWILVFGQLGLAIGSMTTQAATSTTGLGQSIVPQTNAVETALPNSMQWDVDGTQGISLFLYAFQPWYRIIRLLDFVTGVTGSVIHLVGRSTVRLTQPMDNGRYEDTVSTRFPGIGIKIIIGDFRETGRPITSIQLVETLRGMAQVAIEQDRPMPCSFEIHVNGIHSGSGSVSLVRIPLTSAYSTGRRPT